MKIEKKIFLICFLANAMCTLIYAMNNPSPETNSSQVDIKALKNLEKDLNNHLYELHNQLDKSDNEVKREEIIKKKEKILSELRYIWKNYDLGPDSDSDYE